jgi:hypothetical protein
MKMGLGLRQSILDRSASRPKPSHAATCFCQGSHLPRCHFLELSAYQLGHLDSFFRWLFDIAEEDRGWRAAVTLREEIGQFGLAAACGIVSRYFA